MNFKSIVFRELGKNVSLETISIDTIKEDDVLVKIKATGICLSDIQVIDGNMGVPLPVILGHEGSGIIEKVGSNVKNVQKGDHVALSWAPACGFCSFCNNNYKHLCNNYAPIVLNGTLTDRKTRFLDADKNFIYHYSFLSTWSQYSVVSKESCIKIDKDIPFIPASLIGCAVMTGFGAAVNTAKIHPGSSVVILGVGGVGLNIVQGAKICGAEKIIAVDIEATKEKIAKTFGATHFIHPQNGLIKEQILDLTDGLGADYVFEATGKINLMQEAYHLAKRRGMIVYIGIAPDGAKVSFPALKIPREEKIITGSFMVVQTVKEILILFLVYINKKNFIR